MSEASSSNADFLAKWRGRWPEWRIGLVFVPAAERPRVEAWFALLDELHEAAWGGADPTPGLAKLAWWQEELQGWAKGARRHPLSATLQRVDAPWQTLALALRLLPATRDASGGSAQDAVQLRDFVRAVEACEARLFAAAGDGGSAGAVVVAPTQAAKACLQGDSTLARACLDDWPARSHGTRPRRIANALLAARLQAMTRSGTPAPAPGLSLLWATWRAARAA